MGRQTLDILAVDRVMLGTGVSQTGARQTGVRQTGARQTGVGQIGARQTSAT